ncbi:MAG TPA: DUF2247 family protein [Candidatus Kapabacteria bacterium]|nr:DUF2247 family protein [Candidatus Kapabacteria bacterium]
MIHIKIPYDFICRSVDIDWQDILFGLENELISSTVAIEQATVILNNSGRYEPDIVDVASCSPADPIIELVARLARREQPRPEGNVREKWLYIILAWLYDHRHSIADPLSMVEEVYADFDYPEEVAPFVRYMPMVGPDLGSREANEERMVGNWKAYLDRTGERFRNSSCY